MEEASFESLALNEDILSALKKAGYEKPTEIQSVAIPIVLEGSDIMATAQTGTGKTAAFSLPLLQQLLSAKSGTVDAGSEKDGKGNNRKARVNVKALILSPTRELAQQIEESLQTYSQNLSFKIAAVVGGLPIKKQISELKSGVDILVATPGRLLDLMGRRAVDLSQVDFFVLDEADRMLDMGFVHDVNDIARAIKSKRQTLLFSATTSDQVMQLSRVLLKRPERISVDPPQSMADKVVQRVYFVDEGDKRDLMIELLSKEELEHVLVFTRTRSSANVLAAYLTRKGIKADAIHSDKNQRDRQKALGAFDKGEISVLVATDVMARGIDVSGITHVINYELPQEAESFVHRIGRTGRAGSSGFAFSLCDLNDVSVLQSIERFIEEKLEVEEDHSFHSRFVETMKNRRESPFAKKRGGVRRRR